VIANRKRQYFLWGLGLTVLSMALAAFILPRFAPPTLYTNESKARQDLRGLSQVLEQFRADHGRYPTREEALYVLVDPSPGGRYFPSSHGITDPWGHIFIYRPPDPQQKGGPTFYSSGPNGIDEGGSGDDIVLRDEK
jgi:type II secretory pathway pseudopilin PulG